jgi:hypothetical protein
VEFLLGLSKEKARHKIARQKRLARWFWLLGIVAVATQVAFAWRASKHEQATATSTPIVALPLAVTISAATRPPTSAPTHLAAHATERYTASDPGRSPRPTLPPTPTLHVLPPTPTVPTTGYDGQSRPSGQDADERGSSRPHPLGGTQSTPPPPASPLVLFPPPEQVSERTFRLAGTGQPGDAISVLVNHSTIAQAVVDRRGHWQTIVPTEPLTRGQNAFEVRTSQQTSLARTPFAQTPPAGDGENSGQSPLYEHVRFAVTFAPWWLDAPIRLQASLGEGYACAPTVLGMAMDYYHRLDDRYPAPATIELVEALGRKGFISGYGADAQMICDLAIALGYSHSFFYQEWSQAHLRQTLDTGHPVIANVRVNLGNTGYGHSVLVIGLSPDGRRVMFNDPAQGMVESSWAQFDRSWASFGPPNRHGTVVKP